MADDTVGAVLRSMKNMPPPNMTRTNKPTTAAMMQPTPMPPPLGERIAATCRGAGWTIGVTTIWQ
jgi:hypothetical protein